VTDGYGRYICAFFLSVNFIFRLLNVFAQWSIHVSKGLPLLFLLFAFGAHAAAPTITSFTPTSGCSGNFPVVTITGTGFTGASSVKFNGVAATSFTVVSSTQITATPAASTTSGAIKVTNGGTGTSAGTFTVNTSPVAAITPAGPSAICGGAGSLTLTASGGGTYLWNTTGGSATTAAITATTSGTYAVTVTSAAGCTATASNVVTMDPVLTGSASATAESYYGTDNGTATVTPGGGTVAYSYSWSNGGTTQTISALVAGTYTVTVTDALACTVTASATVTQPALVSNGDIDPVASNLMTAPAGSYVIAMDNELQTADSGYFNIKAYGLAITILNSKIPLRWVIKSGKSKDSADFSASATLVFPSFAAASTKSFKAGPFVIFPSDTVNGNIHTIVNTFNAANPTRQIYVYQLTAATTVDVRYTLSQTPKAALLNDGGEAYIHAGYMTIASVPSSNYSTLASAAYDSPCACT